MFDPDNMGGVIALRNNGKVAECTPDGCKDYKFD
jgi:hypothetical protein